MKIVISILAHEKPEIVIDQIENIHRYVPEAWIVLHLHRKFEWGDQKVDFSKHDRVLVNPTSVITLWGNLHHAHHHNFHFVSKEMDFDYFFLHSSSDLFVREGVLDVVKNFDCGVSLLPPQTEFGFNLMAEGDDAYRSIVKAVGAKELWTSQVEGTFYKKELFADLVRIIEKYHRFDTSKSYVHEEIYYPTMISAMDVKRGFPILLREDNSDLPKFDSNLVDKIQSGAIEDHFKTRWKLGRFVTAQVWKGDELFALRPVPRVLDHPLRRYIRESRKVA